MNRGVPPTEVNGADRRVHPAGDRPRRRGSNRARRLAVAGSGVPSSARGTATAPVFTAGCPVSRRAACRARCRRPRKRHARPCSLISGGGRTSRGRRRSIRRDAAKRQHQRDSRASRVPTRQALGPGGERRRDHHQHEAGRRRDAAAPPHRRPVQRSTPSSRNDPRPTSITVPPVRGSPARSTPSCSSPAGRRAAAHRPTGPRRAIAASPNRR